MASFSSIGPASDNRITPHLSAPGFWIHSAQSAAADGGPLCVARAEAGTSMATPALAGATALLRQYLVEGRHPSGQPDPNNAVNPPGALMKALLTNGAEFLTGIHPAEQGGELSSDPNILSGWGMPKLDNSLSIDGKTADGRKVWMHGMKCCDPADMEIVAAGASRDYSIIVADGSKPLKVTLAWHDAPGATQAQQALVNDLDLEVVAPDGVVMPITGQSGPDRLNNLEQVVQNDPAPGVWTLRVRGTSVPEPGTFGGQPFSIVASGSLDDSCTTKGGCDEAVAAFESESAGATLFSGEGDAGLFAAILVMAVLIGLMLLCYFKRNQLMDILTPMLAGSSGLPEGWSKMVDPNSGQPYYYNSNTGESSWEKPAAPASEMQAQTSAGAWQQVETAPGSGQFYWYNAQTGQSQWNPP